MAATVYSLFTDLMEYLILLFLMQYVCSAHMNLCRKNLLTLSGIFVACNFLSSFTKNDYSIALMFLLVEVAVLLYSYKKFTDTLLFFLAFAIFFTLSVIPESIVSSLWPSFEGYFYLSGEEFSLFSLLADSIFLGIMLLLRLVLQKFEINFKLTAKEAIGSIGLVFFSFVYGFLFVKIYKTQVFSFYTVLWEFILAASFLLLVGYYLFSLIETRVKIYRQTLQWNEMEYLRLQLESLQDSNENDASLKKLRHDLKNHLSVIQMLCDEGNYDEVKTYTKELNSNPYISTTYNLTGNKIADMVVQSKKKIAEDAGISFTFSGDLSKLDRLTPPDICGLLSNAYDNAIEACLTQENAYINTHTRSTRNYTVIVITNSVVHKRNFKNNVLPTTKTDTDNHGFGMSIMKQIALKYNGSCSFQFVNDEFQTKITLLT